MKFTPPTAAERVKAIGCMEGLAETLQKALDPNVGFEPVSVPNRGDWLAEHHERGQSFADFVKSKPNRPSEARTKIYLQPLGEFPKGKTPMVDKLKEYAATYFGLKVEPLPHLGLGNNITSRINPYTHNRQILTSDVLAILKKKVPADAFCVLAVTTEDLYPEPSWNFVFGQASLRDRVGVYSFARYDPAFYGKKRTTDYEKTLLRRSCKVLVHETGHMFGLMHCVYFRCVLNGSNHLKESNSRPVHLCPVCLHKLQYSTGLDVVKRYGRLFHFYRKSGFEDEAIWVAGRLQWILGADAAKAIIDPNSEG